MRPRQLTSGLKSIHISRLNSVGTQLGHRFGQCAGGIRHGLCCRKLSVYTVLNVLVTLYTVLNVLVTLYTVLNVLVTPIDVAKSQNMITSLGYANMRP